MPPHRRRVNGQRRIRVLSIFFMVFVALIVLRLFDLQILKGSFYAALAADQHELYKKIFPERGSIYTLENQNGKQNLFPLVTNKKMMMLYAVPKEIDDVSSTANMVIDILGLPESIDMAEVEKNLFADISSTTELKIAEEIKKTRMEAWKEQQRAVEIDKLVTTFNKKERMYEPLRYRLTDEQVAAIKASSTKGLGFQEQDYRFYPEKGLGGQIFGFWGYRGDDKVGQYGLEGYFDQMLTGQYGEIRSDRDALGNVIALGNSSFKEKVDGADLILTLDRAIQYKACQELQASVTSHKAKGGSVIVMNPKTGAILAMCNVPDFSPDEYYKTKNIKDFNNTAIFGAYEPGSIFKPITLAAALDSGKVTPETTYVDTGEVDYGRFKIRNFDDKIYGKQTMTNVLELSLNTGAIFAMRQTTPKVFAQYVRNFGFGQVTGIEMDKELPGDISNLNKNKEIFAATATFGQGITVTPLQIATAMSAIANGGKLMKPYIVSQIIHGNEIKSFYPQEIRQVITPKTAAVLSGMMVSVVENGHAQKAKIPGYRVAGKTGTAQVPGPSGAYKKDEVIGSFVGFVPFSDPKFLIMVRVDEPMYGKLGETVAAPVFTGIAKFALQYYNVPYDKPFK